jgi:hypothetical protein
LAQHSNDLLPPPTHRSSPFQAKDTPGWFGDGWALLTRQERPKARTLSNRQANRAARREEEKLTRAQEGADGVTLVTVTPGAATHGEKTNLDSTTNNVSDVFNPTSSTNGSDTPTDNTPMLRGSSGSSATTSSTPRVSASGAETNSNPMAATNRYVSKKVSFKDVVVLGSPALDRPRRSLLGRAWRKINKRTGEALDITGAAVTGLFADAGRGLSTAADEFVLTTKTLAHTTQRRMKGAAHKVDKEVSKACTKVVDTAKEAKTVCKGKAGMVMQTFQKFNLFRK